MSERDSIVNNGDGTYTIEGKLYKISPDKSSEYVLHNEGVETMVSLVYPINMQKAEILTNSLVSNGYTCKHCVDTDKALVTYERKSVWNHGNWLVSVDLVETERTSYFILPHAMRTNIYESDDVVCLDCMKEKLDELEVTEWLKKQE